MFLSAIYAPTMDGETNRSSSEGLAEHHFDSFSDGLILNGVRSRKKIADLQPCPVCSCTIRFNELQTHFSLEMERLNKLSSSGGSKRKLSMVNNSTAGSSASVVCDPELEVMCSVGGDVYKKVRINRLRRLKRSRRRPDRSLTDGDAATSSSCDLSEMRGCCPICKVNYPMRRLQRHALRCLRDNGEGGTSSMSDVGDTSSEDGTIDVEGDDITGDRSDNSSRRLSGDSMVVYEWCGQERVRATALRAIEERTLFVATSPTQQEDVLQTLVVDGDEDEVLYGPAQFSPTLLALRDDSLPEDTWTGEGGAALMAAGQRQEPYPPPEESHEVCEQQHYVMDRPDEISKAGADRTLIQALRQRLRELEQSQANHAKCHICLSPYTDPVVSIQCWHVHCEVCWVDALRAKKTCPQCMAITTTYHLRRIYI